MSIELNPEQERVIGLAIQAGLIQAPNDAVEMGIATVRRQLQGSQTSLVPSTDDEWFRELSAWIGSHSAATPLLSDEAIDREAIYGSRGL